MPRRIKINQAETMEAIRRLLLKGPGSSGGICKELDISQPVFSRLINKVGPNLLVTGQSSKTRYALKREVPCLGDQIEIYQISPKGEAKTFGRLYAVHPNGFYFKSALENGFYEDLPYFLNDLRPSGFLGRNIPRLHPELGLPEDITAWSGNTVLGYIGQHGSDLIGNLIVGDPAFKLYTRRFKKLSHDVTQKNRATEYEKMALDVLSLGDPGSSAGGEQAKFLTTVGPSTRQTIVKFSAPVKESIGRRRGDLLVCEHIAHKVLHKAGKKAANSEIIEGKTRLFLEVERFDRIPLRGRLAVISLSSLSYEFCDGEQKWPTATQSLLNQKRIPRSIHNDVRFLHLFGKLTANSDMHLGNLSFFLDGLSIKEIAPVYDMLPMLYAPVNEQLVPREFVPPSPVPADADIWPGCWKAACAFWKQAATHQLISASFRKIAATNLKSVKELKELVEMLPPPWNL